jgi:phenylpyruvate tautomerase PptA (4-oxalocrotonate tautomerase family)
MVYQTSPLAPKEPSLHTRAMPLVCIDIRKGHSPKYKRVILDGVHAALIEGFKIPDRDRQQILREHSPEDFEGRGAAPTMVSITAFSGRSREAKLALFEAIARNLAASPGIDENDLLVTVNDLPLDNWGIRGGKQASDLDLGFKIDV